MMKETNEKEWMTCLKEDLQKVEEMHDINAPQQYQLMRTLQEFKLERKKAYKREFILFLFTALIILASYATIAFKMTTVFIWIQGLVILVIPFIFLAEKKHRNKRKEVFRL
jgi:Family of unknown function (DUF5345)